MNNLRYENMDIDLIMSFVFLLMSVIPLLIPLFVLVVIVLVAIYLYRRIRKDFN